jgi:aryl carrier-like protein
MTLTAPLTLARMRADIANAIDLTPEELGLEDNLMDLGLDSLRLMNLTLLWQEAGLKIDFGIFAESATLGEWWQAVEQHRQGA